MQPYTVTFCTMDPNAGANPLWHTCILLSQYDEKTRKMEMVENWGFYGMPATNGDSWLGSLKRKYKVDTDIYGNHGWWRHEDVRYLDLGHGLHGVTFELTEDEFNALQEKCRAIEAGQNKILEMAEAIAKTDGIQPLKKFRNHKWEHISPVLDKLDRDLAKAQNREPYLKPFDLHPVGRTCKVQVLEVLDGILTDQQLQRVTGAFTSISRFSGTQENLYLHSTGPMRQFTKSTGQVVNYRHIDDEGVKVFWTVPPQEMEMLDPHSENFFRLDPQKISQVKVLVSKLQRLEWLFINNPVPNYQKIIQDNAVQQIRILYNNFATIKPKDMPPKNRCCGSVLQWAGFYTKETQLADVVLDINIKVADDFLNSGIDIYLDLLPDAAMDDALGIIERDCNVENTHGGCTVQ